MRGSMSRQRRCKQIFGLRQINSILISCNNIREIDDPITHNRSYLVRNPLCFKMEYSKQFY